jgi:hypothetical protein
MAVVTTPANVIYKVPTAIGFKIINLDCVIGRLGIAIQLPPSILAKLIILKPIKGLFRKKEFFPAP